MAGRWSLLPQSEGLGMEGLVWVLINFFVLVVFCCVFLAGYGEEELLLTDD